jgi:hypothetical protein
MVRGWRVGTQGVFGMRTPFIGLIFLFAISSCRQWPIPKALSKRASDPPHLGTKLDTLPKTGTMTYKLVATNGGGAAFLTAIGQMYDDDLKRVTKAPEVRWRKATAQGVVSDIKAPPDNTLGELFAASDTDSFFLVTRPKLFRFDGANWTSLPDVPLNPEIIIEAPDKRIFIREKQFAFVLINGTWKSLTSGIQLSARGTVGLGPWNPTSIQLVSVDTDSKTPANEVICTRLVNTSSGSIEGMPACRAVRTQTRHLVGDAVNGTVDSFTVLAEPQVTTPDPRKDVFQFSNRSWTVGFVAPVVRTIPTPGKNALLSFAQKTQLSNLVALENGTTAKPVFNVQYPMFSCDMGQPCEQSVVSQDFGVAQDLSAVWILSLNAFDLFPTAWLAHFPLPQSETCLPACKDHEVCVKNASGALCEKLFTLSGSEQKTGWNFSFSAVTAESSFAGVMVSTVDTRTNVNALQNYSYSPTGKSFVTVEPQTPVKVELSIGDYAPRTFVFTTPEETANVGDFGSISMYRGTSVGTVAPNIPVTFIPDAGLVVPTLLPDGGTNLILLHGAPDGGLRSESLSAVSSNLSFTAASSNGTFLALASGAQLSLLNVANKQVTPIISSLNERVESVSFSRDGTHAVIGRTFGISVVNLSSLSEEFVIAGSANNKVQFIQQSKNGNTVLINRPSGGTAIVTSTGEIPVAMNFNDVYLSGDGTRLYFFNATNKTLSTQLIAAGSMVNSISTTASQFAIDADGDNALFVSMSGTNAVISRFVASDSSTPIVATYPGFPQAFSRLGALWIKPSVGTMMRMYFPTGNAVRQVTNKNVAPTIDSLGNIQFSDNNSTVIISETDEIRVAPKAGVYFNGARRLNAQNNVSTLFNLTETKVTFLASPTATMTFAPALTRNNPMETVNWPCALYSVPKKTYEVNSVSGVISVSDSGNEWFCYR